MQPTEKNVKYFQEVLSEICDKETSLDPNFWTPDNPLWGHCAVVSMLAQDFFGGDILETFVENVSESDSQRRYLHYWNRLPNGKEVDFTKSQFGNRYSSLKFKQPFRSRSKTVIFLIGPRVLKSYVKLTKKFLQQITEGNWERVRLRDEVAYLKRQK